MSHKFVDYGANCTYTVSFHRGKWIDKSLLSLSDGTHNLYALKFDKKGSNLKKEILDFSVCQTLEANKINLRF